MGALITAELVDLGLEAPDRHVDTRSLAEPLVAAGRVTDVDGFLADVRKRRSRCPPGWRAGSASRIAGPPL